MKLRRPSSVDHRKLAAAISSTLRLEGLSISQHPIDLETPLRPRISPRRLNATFDKARPTIRQTYSEVVGRIHHATGQDSSRFYPELSGPQGVLDKGPLRLPKCTCDGRPIRYQRTMYVPTATEAVTPMENRSRRSSTCLLLR